MAVHLWHINVTSPFIAVWQRARSPMREANFVFFPRPPRPVDAGAACRQGHVVRKIRLTGPQNRRFGFFPDSECLRVIEIGIEWRRGHPQLLPCQDSVDGHKIWIRHLIWLYFAIVKAVYYYTHVSLSSSKQIHRIVIFLSLTFLIHGRVTKYQAD